MILIISSNNDVTTNEVIDWLRFYNSDFIRIDSTKLISIQKAIINVDSTELYFEIDGTDLKLSQITSIWYRRSWINFKRNKYTNEALLNSEFENQIENQLIEENFYLSQFLLSEFKKKSLNDISDTRHNKLGALAYAKKIGLMIPSTIIATAKKDVIKFKATNSNIITKNFSPGVFIILDGSSMNGYTTELSDQEINDLPDCFFPMLFQQKIEKAFELRIFYLNNQFYTSAIFSQNDDQTKVDFRNYNVNLPNRTPTYELPINIKELLKTFMKYFSLNSGSIDMIVTNEGEYIFLEVNPIGQIAQVSIPCNYYLQHEIAKSLIKNIHEREN